MRRLLAAALREWQAAKRAIKRPALRWLLDRTHAWFADVPPDVIRGAIRQSFSGDSAGLRKVLAEARAILGTRISPVDIILFAALEQAAADRDARMN